jgi:hypothetical protein
MLKVQMELKDDSELQLRTGDGPQMNPIKAGIEPQDKSLYPLFSSLSLTIKWSLNRNASK